MPKSSKGAPKGGSKSVSPPSGQSGARMPQKTVKNVGGSAKINGKK